MKKEVKIRRYKTMLDVVILKINKFKVYNEGKYPSKLFVDSDSLYYLRACGYDRYFVHENMKETFMELTVYIVSETFPLAKEDREMIIEVL